MNAIKCAAMLAFFGTYPLHFCMAVTQTPPGATIYGQRILALPSASSPLEITIYPDVQDSTAGVLLEKDGKQVGRATQQSVIRLSEGTGFYDLTGDGVPNIVLVGVAGGKTLAAVVYSFQNERLAIIGQWSGWGFKVIHPGGKPVVAVTPTEYGSLTDLYIWDGKTFQHCNERFPEFYKAEIQAQWRAVDQSHVPAYVFAQACQLGATALVYGKKYAEAEALCIKARQAVNTTSRLIPSQIGSSADIVRQDQAAAERQINSALAAVDQAKQRDATTLRFD